MHFLQMPTVKMIALASVNGAAWRSKNFRYLIAGGKKYLAQKTQATVGTEPLTGLSKIAAAMFI